MSSVVSFSGGVVMLRPDAARSLAKAVIQASDAMAQRGQVIDPKVLNLAIEVSSAAGNPEPPSQVIEETFSYEHITTKEAAKALGCSPRNVRKLAADGRLPGQQRGTGWLFRREDVEVFKQYRK
ncbi:helix-turn-helix domain-containing protein [Corynebacterium casei]|uniref:helix-turn-helix domain-containing protein n=1 Tax=Corynebacterium casei TaxID=160386 RepID=UPI003FD567FE